jgi:hypothetical protein
VAYGVQDARKMEAMKASSFTVALGVLVAISALVGCDNAGQSQSPLASSQARSQGALPANIRHATGSGSQKVGRFWWVWNTVTPSPGLGTIDAYCPAEYVPTGGSTVIISNETTGSPSGAFIYGSYPLDAVSTFGWEAKVYGFPSSQQSPIEIWVICAKEMARL